MAKSKSPLLFQSHAGSIEAHFRARFVKANSEFQSHAGSIEAVPDLPSGWSVDYGFNPTLVRLRRRAKKSIPPREGIVSIPRWFD